MANHKSAKKRARQSVRRRQQNKGYMSGVRTAVKAFTHFVNPTSSTQLDEVEGAKRLSAAQSKIAKAAAKGMLHPNNAARKIKRMAAALRRLSATT